MGRTARRRRDAPARGIARIVDQQVDRRIGSDARDHALHAGVIREVGRQYLDVDAVRSAQRRGERLEPVGPARDEHQRVAGAGEMLGVRASDAGGRAGDEGTGWRRHGGIRQGNRSF